MNEEQVKKFEEQRALEEKLLIESDWLKVNENIWSKNNKQVDQGLALTLVIVDKLKEMGWREITEFLRVGKKEWNKPVQKYTRYQSPITKRIYSYLEAELIYLNSEEEVWSDNVSTLTFERNNLLNNYEGDTINMWFYVKENGVYMFELDTY